MKKFLLFPLLVSMTALIVPACSDDDILTSDDEDTIAINDDTITINDDSTIYRYNGTVIVNGTYIEDSIVCQLATGTDGATLNIFKVKFAANMPVTIDLTVPQIPFERKTDKVTFGGDSIVPMMGVAPVPAFMFETIEGEASSHTLNFNATILGRGTITFSGNEIVE